jgi:hypothetical protein
MSSPNEQMPTPQANIRPPVMYAQYPVGLGKTDGKDNWINFEAFDFKSQSPVFSIALYIPGDALNTSYKADYTTTQLGALGAMGDKAIKTLQNQGGPAGGMSLDGLKSAIAAGSSAQTSEGGTVGLLGAAAKADLMVTGTKTIMERAQGAVLNPYTVAAYNGPTDMRTHDFTFQMLPQDEDESRACIKIVNAFKKSMLPSHGGGSETAAPSMLFGYPDQYRINFFINGEELPDDGSSPMFNIGKSVCTACDLDFTTENVPLFFGGTQYPVSISMKLSFMELEVMYRERIEQGA